MGARDEDATSGSEALSRGRRTVATVILVLAAIGALYAFAAAVPAVAPRVLFEMMRYKPSDEASRLAMPVLVCIADSDREVPPELSRQIAENAPLGEVRSYPTTHFDIYRPKVRSRVVEDQMDFLHDHL